MSFKNTSDRLITLRELESLNQESLEQGYNCNIFFDVYAKHLKAAIEAEPGLQWRGMDTKVLLVNLMWHDYPQGAAVRCQVFSDGLVPGLLKLDVRESSYFELEHAFAA